MASRGGATMGARDTEFARKRFEDFWTAIGDEDAGREMLTRFTQDDQRVIAAVAFAAWSDGWLDAHELMELVIDAAKREDGRALLARALGLE